MREVIVWSVIARVARGFIDQRVCERSAVVKCRDGPVAGSGQSSSEECIRPLRLVLVDAGGDVARRRGTGRVIINSPGGMRSGRGGRRRRLATKVLGYGVHDDGRGRHRTQRWILPVDGEVGREHGGERKDDVHQRQARFYGRCGGPLCEGDNENNGPVDQRL